jgi:beta-1,4-mannosyltransferase
MRVTLFARVDPARNPYILLYKAALEHQQLVVHLEREFSLNWLITQGKSCDAIHLHWIEAAYGPAKRDIRSGLVNKLLNNRFVMPLRGVLRLADFSAALFLAKLQGKIIVYTAHNLTAHSKRSWPFIVLNRMAHHLVLSLSNQVHVHNHYARRLLETTYKRKDGVTVVPHGNYVGCYPNQISRLAARRQLGLPGDAFVYLFLGQLRLYKGLEDLVEAFEQLQWPMARLLIAGHVSKSKTSYNEKLLSWTRNNPSIKLVPEFIPDESLQLYMNACNVYVLPYKDTTTSGSALLALSFGRPIVAPAIATFPEIVTPETGILYNSSQPNALFSALQQARERSWSESRILDYAHQFDWDKLGPQLAKLYQRNLTDNNNRK